MPASATNVHPVFCSAAPVRTLLVGRDAFHLQPTAGGAALKCFASHGTRKSSTQQHIHVLSAMLVRGHALIGFFPEHLTDTKKASSGWKPIDDFRRREGWRIQVSDCAMLLRRAQ
jgi:hypothetical protein